ncbi:MAG: GDP-mannose 4,6-dehydratase [Candidatus Thiodiazotropha taylori]|uniref:GDP-mannose 4,6-dehydratase n=1 Tax=Candidatus Thiodiazotropha taylori TaxID=2792791 RepID=A0A9E4KAF4_9GAMM|nr:GDP-mannose 4,6-dehydratase [Candidatus Thiodiazotropha taylori]MCW4255076.1 GDP-mannose 4,6-dehydratase [Candidatus Thiodiazotropha taylori]
MKTALVTGVTGQDGGYLAELLLEKGYEVHSIKRRTAADYIERIAHIIPHPNFHLHYGDLTDTGCLMKLFATYEFDEVYNLGAQSHVRVSFDIPEYTADVDALGTVRLLECIRTLGMIEKTKFYQASTSELYGKVVETPQKETTPFYPRSPYGVAKLYSYWIVKNYRESYGLHGSNGILFNHESPHRGVEFVTQKIIRGAADVYHGRKDKISLGNLDAQRDWGHAKDYVRGMWQMLQQPEGDDYVLATGELNSVRNLVEIAFNRIGQPITWEGEGVNEHGLNPEGNVVVDIDPTFFRPAEVELLLGDPTKAEQKLGWKREYDFEALVNDMMEAAL